jgi:hypothetical protein
MVRRVCNIFVSQTSQWINHILRVLRGSKQIAQKHTMVTKKKHFGRAKLLSAAFAVHDDRLPRA